MKLRVHCNFDIDTARFSYSLDGREFKPIGSELKLPFQLKTFQGVRYALFHYNENGELPAVRRTSTILVSEPRPRGLTKPIPLTAVSRFSDLRMGTCLPLWTGSPGRCGKTQAQRIPNRGPRAWPGCASDRVGRIPFGRGRRRVGEVKLEEANPATPRHSNGWTCSAAIRCCSPWRRIDTSSPRRASGLLRRTMRDPRRIERTDPVSSGASCADLRYVPVE